MHCPDCGLFFGDDEGTACRLCDGELKQDILCGKCASRNFGNSLVCTVCGEALALPSPEKVRIELEKTAEEQVLKVSSRQSAASSQPAVAERRQPEGWVPPSQRRKPGKTNPEPDPSTKPRSVAETCFPASAHTYERSRDDRPRRSVSSRSTIDNRDTEVRTTEQFMADQSDIFFAVLYIFMTWAAMLLTDGVESRAFWFALVSLVFGGYHFLATTTTDMDFWEFLQFQLEVPRATPIGLLCFKLITAIGSISLIWAFICFFNDEDWTFSMVWAVGLLLISAVWLLNFVTGLSGGKSNRAEMANDFFMSIGYYTMGMFCAAFFAGLMLFSD
ncbi:MAG: hypothetical protein CVV64_17980 [Candidatus Wallbacteria bacterium HGW-Wallbacteria-1]|uniref:Uncharacterized protein n=1 Tax=Candidatus Wallbacteria bacterium HGW-Wallbacteria-1 TaxID=2013854 RepID=A0A2N1PJV8_9BACT|nr:MAG: hypothetical protein CVV64_17980 [Candidatus Wallbacteria bacterium HGW-Wallbacteria-1]